MILVIVWMEPSCKSRTCGSTDAAIRCPVASVMCFVFPLMKNTRQSGTMNHASDSPMSGTKYVSDTLPQRG
jgi:hypothetical protein